MTEALTSTPAEKPAEQTDSRRVHQRFNIKWPMRAVLPGKRIAALRTRDVSLGGIGFNCPEQLPLGKEILVEITPHVDGTQYAIRAKGVIIYNAIYAGSEGYGHGLKFTQLPKVHEEEIGKILKSLSRKGLTGV